jgi:glycosyltransferase involved in cell wall biosynthesis
LVFAGPDWGAAEYLHQLSGRENVRVIFTGALTLTDLKSALVACDVFVVPSRKEASGIASLEAMLCGAPVVATRVGGIQTIVRHQETGVLVPAGDHHAMADAIRKILEEKEFSARLAANGKVFALGFSIDRTVERLEAFYEDILRE